MKINIWTTEKPIRELEHWTDQRKQDGTNKYFLSFFSFFVFFFMASSSEYSSFVWVTDQFSYRPANMAPGDRFICIRWQCFHVNNILLNQETWHSLRGNDPLTCRTLTQAAGQTSGMSPHLLFWLWLKWELYSLKKNLGEETYFSRPSTNTLLRRIYVTKQNNQRSCRDARVTNYQLPARVPGLFMPRSV